MGRRGSCTTGLILLVWLLGCSIDPVTIQPATYAWELHFSPRHEILQPASQELVSGSRQLFSLTTRGGSLVPYTIHWRVSGGRIVGPDNQQDLVWDTPEAGPAWIGVELFREGESWIACQQVLFADEQLQLSLLAGTYRLEGHLEISATMTNPAQLPVELSWGCSAGQVTPPAGAVDVTWEVIERGEQQVWCRASAGNTQVEDTLSVTIPNLPPIFEIVEPYFDDPLCNGLVDLYIHAEDRNLDSLALEIEPSGFIVESLQSLTGSGFLGSWRAILRPASAESGLYDQVLRLSDGLTQVSRVVVLPIQCP